MRIFIIVGHKATTEPSFSLEDIPGTSGRLDILCRSVTSAFVLSHGIRKDVLAYLVLLGGENPKTIQLVGESLRHLNPDERSTAALLKKALAVEAAPGWSMSTPGIFVRSGGLPRLLEDLRQRSVRLIYLKEDGKDFRCLRDEPLEEEMAFVLGDHSGMTAEEEALLTSAGAEVVALGPTSLHADHCIVVTNWLLDSKAFMSGCL